MEEKLRELLSYAIERLEATDDLFKKKQLADGIGLGNELLAVYDSVRKAALGQSFGESAADSILSSLNPVAARYLGQILTHFGHGGLFGGNNGRTNEEYGPESEN